MDNSPLTNTCSDKIPVTERGTPLNAAPEILIPEYDEVKENQRYPPLNQLHE
jgi:hypothetical protein